MKKAIGIICSVILCLALMIFIFTFSVSLPIYFRPFYYMQIESLDLVEVTGYSAAEIREAYDEMLDYLTLPGREFSTGVFQYSESGKAHFEDCRLLFSLNHWGLVVSGLIIVVICILRYTKVLKLSIWNGGGLPLIAGSSLLGLSCVVAIGAGANFSWAFAMFHKIFFPGKDNWIFDWRVDEIIMALPSTFFLNCAVFIGASMVLLSLGMITYGVVSGILHARAKRKKQPSLI